MSAHGAFRPPPRFCTKSHAVRPCSPFSTCAPSTLSLLYLCAAAGNHPHGHCTWQLLPSIGRGLSAGHTPRRTARHMLGSRPSHALAHAPVRPARPCSLTRRINICMHCSLVSCAFAQLLPPLAPTASLCARCGGDSPSRHLWAPSPCAAVCLQIVSTHSRTRSDRAHVQLGGGSRSRPLPHCGCG